MPKLLRKPAGKREKLRLQIWLLAIACILFPILAFLGTFFLLAPIKLPVVEWYHLTIIIILIGEIFLCSSLYKKYKAEAELRLVKPKEYELIARVALLVASIALGIVFAVLYALSSVTIAAPGKELYLAQRGNISYLALAVLLPIGPISFYEYFRFKKVDKMEEKFPDFLRDLSEYWRGGLSMSAAITALSKTEYGALTTEVNKMSTQISWGVAFQEVLKLLADRVRTKLVTRSVSLIDEANRAGGRISDILITASNDAREIKWLQAERKKGTSMYVIIVYIGFFVYLGIVGILAGIFLPAIVGAGAAGAAGAQLGGAGGVAISKIDLPFMAFIFFCSMLIQALGNGIVGGIMGEGKLTAGLRHAFIMIVIGWVVFAGIIYPFTVDLEPPSSSIESISGVTELKLKITVEVTDPSGIDQVELFYRYSSDSISWDSWRSAEKKGSGPWEFTFNAMEHEGSGWYEFCAIATDTVGNFEHWPKANILRYHV